MLPEPYTVKLDPDTSKTLKMYLYKNVQNVEDIRNKIVKGEWNCAIIKPSLIADPLQVAVAANMAVVAEKQNTMVTRTVFAEILFNLSMTRNISKSLSKFGIEKGTEMLVCFIVSEDVDESEDILKEIQGEQIVLSELQSYSSLKQIQSEYKLKNNSFDEELLDVVVSRIATKNIVPLK